MRKSFALTTSDNPNNPITHFDEWYQFDREKQYKTCEYLARMAPTSSALSDALNDDIIEAAIDDIVKFNVIGMITGYKVNYVKVVA